MAISPDIEARLVIDEEIREHELAILALKTRRNTHNPTARLPLELLSLVFLFGKWQSQENPDEHRSPERRWLNVAGVCRHWRDIALDTPYLWSTINLSASGHIKELLERSKSVPLEIFCKPDLDLHSQDVARTILADIRRIMVLDISYDDRTLLNTLLEFALAPVASTLQILRLSKRYPTAIVGVPANLLWNSMPVLSTLELQNTLVPCDLPILPRLSRLIISSLTSIGPQATVPWLIRLFHSIPNIEEITVTGLSSNSLDDLTTSSPVLLPKLSRLYLTAQDLAGAAIFNWIDYPSSARIAFGLLDTTSGQLGSEFSDLQVVCTRLRRLVESSANLACEIYVTLASENFRFTVQVFLTEDSPYPAVTFFLPRPTKDNVADYTQLCSALPLQWASMLAVNGFMNHLPDLGWETLFPSLTRLTFLSIRSSGSRLVKGLHKDRDAATPPMPNLGALSMRNCSFREPDIQMYDALTGTLNERRDCGMKVKILRLASCDIMEDTIKDIRKYVDVEVYRDEFDDGEEEDEVEDKSDDDDD